MTRRAAIIPPSQRLGLSRLEAADYIGVSPSHFDGLVRSGLMPPAKRVGTGRLGWDRRRLDTAYDQLPDATAPDRVNDRPDGYDARFEDMAL